MDNFGADDARLLIVGLAPGLSGANRTGRPFTGDYAGDVLYAALLNHGFAHGAYARRPDDGLLLDGVMITNAVRCVPPENKPLPSEIKICRTFLEATIAGSTELKVILTLGRVAHESVVRALGAVPSRVPFRHGSSHTLVHELRSLKVFNSYHCSRYNINTGVLTPSMFDSVVASVRTCLNDWWTTDQVTS